MFGLCVSVCLPAFLCVCVSVCVSVVLCVCLTEYNGRTQDLIKEIICLEGATLFGHSG